MMRHLFVGVLALIGCITLAHAEKRVALVVGNSTYLEAGRLTNPRNDAQDVAVVLKRLQFQVTELHDLNTVEI